MQINFINVGRKIVVSKIGYEQAKRLKRRQVNSLEIVAFSHYYFIAWEQVVQGGKQQLLIYLLKVV